MSASDRWSIITTNIFFKERTITQKDDSAIFKDYTFLLPIISICAYFCNQQNPFPYNVCVDVLERP